GLQFEVDVSGSRDAARRDELKGLASQFAQVQGALMIMELDAAAGLNAAVASRVQQFAKKFLGRHLSLASLR
ncbi:MAG TPA: hypothetical protein PLD60_13295, partial [Leptospiraceae bacterium]|nr:hypothetical protein [Leptospiraceae bacterium]